MLAHRRLVLLTTAVAASLLLAGCSAGAPKSESSSAKPSHSAKATPTPTKTAAAGGSKQQECSELMASAQSAQAELSDAYSKVATDPNAAVASLQKFDTEFAASAAEVKDPELAPAAKKGSDALHQMVTDLQTAVQTKDANAVKQLQTDAQAVQAAFTEIGQVCGAS